MGELGEGEGGNSGNVEAAGGIDARAEAVESGIQACVIEQVATKIKRIHHYGINGMNHVHTWDGGCAKFELLIL